MKTIVMFCQIIIIYVSLTYIFPNLYQLSRIERLIFYCIFSSVVTCFFISLVLVTLTWYIKILCSEQKLTTLMQNQYLQMIIVSNQN